MEDFLILLFPAAAVIFGAVLVCRALLRTPPSNECTSSDGHDYEKWTPEGKQAWYCQWRSCKHCGHTQNRKT